MNDAVDSLDRDRGLDRRQWVEPELSSARIDAGYHGVLAKEAGAKTSARAVVLAATAVTAAAAAALFVMLTGGQSPSALVGSELTTHSESMSVALADGSTIEAQPHTALSVLSDEAGEVSFSLSRGAATFEVARDPSRDFVVVAGDVRVRVVGTRFLVAHSVADEQRSVEVVVERGIVEVEANGEVRRLMAGERWQRTDTVTPNAADERAERPDDIDEIEDVSAENGTNEESGERDRGAGAHRHEPGPTAEQLFDDARVARSEGRHRAAARAYEALIDRHRRDGRAGIAALELGRLRMDRLGDPAGAAEAFATALRLAPASPLREDTMARLVRAREAAGQGAACRRQRTRYLARYPDGRHAADIAQRCD